MPLDPRARQLLEQLAAAPGPGLEDIPLAEMRAGLRAASARLTGNLDTVAAIEDVEVPGPEGPIAVRGYGPEGEGPFPVLVALHGGGFVLGSVDEHEGVARALARRGGVLVASVEYRLAPEHPFPAALEDCYAATTWLASHASRLGGQGSRLAVSGDSAGANLAAAVTLASRDRGGPDLCFQLLTCPALDATMASPSVATYGQGYGLTAEAMAGFWRQYLGGREEPTNPYVSPLLAPDLRGLPPALVITAEYDPLRDEGEAYAARLREAGVDAVSSRYQGMIHGFVGMGCALRQSAIAIEEATAALRRAMV